MTLSFVLRPFDPTSQRRRVRATVTTEHSSSSYGQPVIVLEDGDAVDHMSWMGCDYEVVRATKAERQALASMGLTHSSS